MLQSFLLPGPGPGLPGLTFNRGDNNRLYTKLYDKRNDFNFHIEAFPFLSRNKPSGPFIWCLHFAAYQVCKMLHIL